MSIKSEEKYKINFFNSHLKVQKNTRKITHKIRRRNEIIKFGAEINDIEKRKNKKINGTKNKFCEKINTFDKSLARMKKRQREEKGARERKRKKKRKESSKKNPEDTNFQND